MTEKRFFNFRGFSDKIGNLLDFQTNFFILIFSQTTMEIHIFPKNTSHRVHFLKNLFAVKHKMFNKPNFHDVLNQVNNKFLLLRPGVSRREHLKIFRKFLRPGHDPGI